MTHPCAIVHDAAPFVFVHLFDKKVSETDLRQVRMVDTLVKKMDTDGAPLRHKKTLLELKSTKRGE
jgi:hypothetical protein